MVSLDREINEKTERLKQIKAGLVAEARSREDELIPTEGGGTRWTAEGGDGCIARVNFPAPTLKAKIDGEGKAIEKIKQLAGGVFSRLFIPAISYKPSRASARKSPRCCRQQRRKSSSSFARERALHA